MSGKPQQQEQSAIDSYKSKEEPLHQDNMIVPLPTPQSHHHIPDGGGDDPAIHNSPPNPPSSAPPKKRAETWAQEETRALISLRKEIDMMFNTSKSNKHLWDRISFKMREKGFDRSPTMCTDKWRNLLKEFKKAKQNNQNHNGNGSVKMNFYRDIGEILKERSKDEPPAPPPPPPAGDSKVESFMQFADKAIPICGENRTGLSGQVGNMALTFGTTVGQPQPSQLEPPEPQDFLVRGHGKLDEGHGRAATDAGGSCEGMISMLNNSRIFHIASTAEYYLVPAGIDDASLTFGPVEGTRRAFWLEDEDNVVRTLDRDMPLGNYTLHVDEGLTIKVCCYEDTEHLPVHTEDKTFYTEDDFRDFLSRRCWNFLREYNGYRNIDSMDELCPGAVYRGVN
ncbi:trihelix transcription factor gt-4 [Phtheirospermum japonicum]|uniref:Trihelix transcription factor gt-4 n=1 Tax=Phtheirospermum japonicum TaxID=374723 RepID=A0A830C4C9_9LAMI|nr:trihelix transcription factor gt-4 [Phtheirospermum japonicum]